MPAGELNRNGTISDFDRLDTIRGITIDGIESRDLDDAIWLDHIGDIWRLQVSISDVGSAVQIGSREAEMTARTGSTRYCAGGNAPMLPRRLSEDLLSLLPHQSRSVMVVTMDMDHDYRVISTDIHRSTLISEGRYTYLDAAAAIGFHNLLPEHQDMLVDLGHLATSLLAKRQDAGAMTFSAGHGWGMDESGVVRKIGSEQDNIGHIIVQECMILTNRSVAEYALRHGLPFLFRNHKAPSDAPSSRKMAMYVHDAIMYGQHSDLIDMQGRIAAMVGRAEYGSRAEGHYGLNLAAYTHFTSPIRRRADLVNHWSMIAHLEGRPPTFDGHQMADEARRLTDLERSYDEARSEEFTRMARQVADRDLAQTEDVMMRLPKTRFYRTIKGNLDNDQPDQRFVSAVIRRVRSGDLTSKSMFRMMFQSRLGSWQWDAIKDACLGYLSENPDMALALLEMGRSIESWPAMTCEYRKHPAHWTCRSSIQIGDRVHFSKIHGGGDKMMIKKESAIDLCRHISMMEMTPDRYRVQRHVKCKPRLDFGAIDSHMRSGQFTAALHELAAVAKLSNPVFETEVGGTPHCPTIRCRATVTMDGREYSSIQSGSSIKEAKSRACALVLQNLKEYSDRQDNT